MKKWIVMVCISFYGAAAFSEVFDVTPYLGDFWYGLYFNGEKVGFLLKRVAVKGDEVQVVENAQFKVTMSGAKQGMGFSSTRVYDASGALRRIDAQMTDPAQVSTFQAEVVGDQLVLKSNLGGATREEAFPRPRETLQDSLRLAIWARSGPERDTAMNFSLFEPMYQREVSGVARIRDVEERILNGVKTRVYVIHSVLDLMDIESLSYVTENGVTLEDVVSGVFTMRLEPEEAAKDVAYSVDTMVSNAVLLDAPISNPRTRDRLKLILRGPLRAPHLFSDMRQSAQMTGDDLAQFESILPDLSGLEIPRIPITDEAAARLLRPSAYVQSDNPRLIEQAKEIIGEETCAKTVAEKLCRWVSANMRNVFSARLSNALEVLDSLEGDCTEHTVLFVGLARAVGLPAKEVAGLVYVDSEQPGFYFHQWASVWLGEWVDVDPTFNQLPVDVTHIKLAEGDSFQQAKILPLIGRLQIEALSNPAAEGADSSDSERVPGAPTEVGPKDTPCENTSAQMPDAVGASRDASP